MRYEEPGLTIQIDESHHAFVQARALVMHCIEERSAGREPETGPASPQNGAEELRRKKVLDEITRLWSECGPNQRLELTTLAERGELRQAEVEAILHISPSKLRAWHAGLAKICKRIGWYYPIRTVGRARDVRRFSLDPKFAELFLEIARKQP